jgi:hypothetical protein
MRTKTIILSGLLAAMVACTTPSDPNDPINQPQKITKGMRLLSLTSIDGPVADAFKNQQITVEQGAGTGEPSQYDGLLIDGDHSDSAEILKANTMIQKFYNAKLPVLFLDVNALDDAPGILKNLGFASQIDTAAVFYRASSEQGIPTLTEERLSAGVLAVQDPARRSTLLNAFLGKLVDSNRPATQSTANLRAQADDCPTNPVKCPSLPIPPKDPSLLRAIVTSETKVISTANLPQKAKLQLGGGLTFDYDLVLQDKATAELITASVSQNIYVTADFTQGTDCVNASKTVPYNVPRSCLRWGVAVYPYINVTANEINLGYFNKPWLNAVLTAGGTGTPYYSDFYLLQPIQTEWKLGWKIGVNDSKTAIPLIVDQRTPTNTIGQKNVANTRAFSLGIAGGAALEFGAEGPKIGPEIKVGASWKNSTSTSTEIEDWEITDKYDGNTQFAWEYKTQNPNWEPRSYRPGDVLKCPQNGNNAPNLLSQGNLAMAPSFSYTVTGTAITQDIKSLDLWFTAEGRAGLPILCEQSFSKTKGKIYLADQVNLTEEAGTHLSIDVEELFKKR